MGLATVKVTRQWKRDGSKNQMLPEAAVANLRRNGHDGTPDWQIYDDLVAGHQYETEHALFYIKPS